MFDHITVLSTSTIGQLAEVLLFYRKVTLYLSERQIRTLFQKVHPETFVSFLEQHRDNIELRWITWKPFARPLPTQPEVLSFGLGDEYTAGIDEPLL